MNHIDFEDLSAYLDEELAPEDRRRVEEHLAACHTCRDELASLSWSVTFARALPRASVPFDARFHVPVPPVPPQAVPKRYGGWLAAVLATSGVAVAVFAVAVAVQQSGGTLANLSSGQQAPAPAMDAPAAVADVAGEQDAAGGDSEGADREVEAADRAEPAVGGAGDEVGGEESASMEMAAESRFALATAESVATRVALAEADADTVEPLPPAANAVSRTPSRPRTASAQPTAAPAPSSAGAWFGIALGAIAAAGAAWALHRRSRRQL